MGRAIVPTVVGTAALVVAFVLFRPVPPRPIPPGVDPNVVTTERLKIRVVAITEALDQPWALAFLPEGDMLITERGGRLRLIHDGHLSAAAITGIPPVDTRKQDGLMDLALHPAFAENRTLFFTYSKNGPKGDTPVLARARFEGGVLSEARDLFVADAWSDFGGNTGSRIAFAPDGTIYMTVGDRHEQPTGQDLHTHKGKILRLNEDGTVPADNPFVGRRDGARPEIFAYGVRNPQGLFVDATSGTIWETEHGPMGGDELNIIVRGHNYGWAAITYGKNYDGTTITNETRRDGMDQPIVQWTPSIAPSGLTLYTGDRIPEWRGQLFLGALSFEHLRRVQLQDGRAVAQEELLGNLRGRRIVAKRPLRVRDVRQGPDRLLYILTDSGALLRLEPAV